MVNGFHNDYDDNFEDGYSLAFGSQGTTTNPQTPNQITELGKILNTGIKNVEIGALQPDVFDSIPRQHLEEMRRTAKLSDSKISLHAPMVDPSGFTQQGWSEEQRIQNEAQISSIIERAHRLDPDGNIPVTIHSTGGVPGTTWIKEKGVPERKQMMIAVEQETGQLIPLRHEVLHWPQGNITFTPDDRLRTLNKTKWDEEKLKLLSYQKTIQELEIMNQNLTENNPQWLELSLKKEEGIKLREEEEKMLNHFNGQMTLNNQHIEEHLEHLGAGLNNLHHKYIKDRMKENEIKNIKDPRLKEKKLMEFKGWSDNLSRLRKALIKDEEAVNKALEEKKPQTIQEQKKLMREVQKIDENELLSVLSQLPTPQTYKPVDDFAAEKTAETISNAALNAYKKFGDKAPIISLENVYPDWALSRADSLRKAVLKTRELFTEKLAKEKGIDKKAAAKVAEKLIGVTWDMGHINMLRKYGYTEKEIVEESRKIAKEVKHVHVTDNFGYGDTHLAPGMGNVPIKEQLQELEKAGRLSEVRQIVEAGALPQHFGVSSVAYQASGLNSPLYSYENSPTWSQIKDQYASYMVGYGDSFLPTQHYSMSGAGFSSNLPRELGGTSPGTRSRFAGTPNQ